MKYEKKLLLDTCALLWIAKGEQRLANSLGITSPAARSTKPQQTAGPVVATTIPKDARFIGARLVSPTSRTSTA